MHRRVGLGMLLFGMACTVPTPLGLYRLPMEGPGGVELRTLLVRVEGNTLVLYDAQANQELGRASSQATWADDTVPFAFEEPKGDPLTLYVRDGVLEDAQPRPWSVIPVPPLVRDVDRVHRVTLASNGVERTFVAVGGRIFAEQAEPQPALSARLTPLEVLNSVAGVGLALPPPGTRDSEWRDAMSYAVPPLPGAALPCGRPIVSLSRHGGMSVTTVPAGTFETLVIDEIIDTCRQPQMPELLIFEYQRTFAPGLGPVRLSYTGSDGKKRRYLLTSTNVVAGGNALWPLAMGNSWTYEVHDENGQIVGAPVEMRVVRDEEVIGK